VGVATLAQPIVHLLIGEAFRETTVLVLPIAIFAASLRFLRIHTCDQAMLLLERTDLSMIFTIIESTLNAAFCAAGLYFGGLVGGALGMMLGTTITSIAGFAYCFTRLDLPAPAPWTGLRILLACAVMSAVIHALPYPGHALSLTLTIFAGALVYAMAIVLLFPEIRAPAWRQLRRFVEAPAL
jgi:O-antigen/teichoic acid export membrane protein